MPQRQPRNSRPRAAGRISATAQVAITGAEAPTAAAPARFRMVAYTGEPMRICQWADPVVVDLETADVSGPRIPALYDHWADIGSVVGQVETLAIEDRQLVAAGAFTIPPADPERGPSLAERVLALARAGYQWQASVGADPATVEEVKAGAVGVANWGRQYPGPCVIGRGCKFRELSFVVLGGDRRTSVVAGKSIRGAAMTFEQWLLAMGFADPAALDDIQRANLELLYKEQYPDAATEPDPAADPAADPAPAADPLTAEGDPLAMTEEEKKKAEEEAAKLAQAAARAARIRARRDPVAADNARIAGNLDRVHQIQGLAAQYGSPRMKVGGREVDVAAHAIRSNWTKDRTELEMIRASRHQGPVVAVGGGAPLHGARGAAVIEAALCAALGQKDLEKKFKPDVLETAHREFRGRLGLHETLMIAASANGYQPRAGERVHGGNVREVLAHAFPRIRAAGSSTVSLPGIFSNVANKELLAGYMEEDQTWREVAAVKPVTDFKTVTSYRLLDNMAYEQVGADGKIKHGSVSEESYTRQANTYAKMFALTRRDLINDDLGAFGDLRNRLGRGAAQKFNDVFWSAFLYDHATFFTTARTNYITGATTTLLTDGVGLALAVKAFRLMTSPTGDGTKRLGGQPVILLVPPELEAAAEGLYVNQNLGSVKTSDANIYANKYRPVTCAWLSDSAFTGYSTTAWYLLRSPGVMPAVVASFLNGQEAPTVEDSDADFDTLGVQFRGYHDFGVDQAEYLCGIKSKGAA